METSYTASGLLYDPSMYDGLNSQTDDIEFYSAWMRENEIRNALELCCGTGRITIPLARMGVKITGLDIDDAMLAEARRKSKELRLDIEYLKGDMRSFRLKGKYHLVFIPFNSIHCLYTHEDIDRAFGAARNHLDDDGYFIIDYFNPSLENICENQKKEREIAEFTATDGRHVRIIETMSYESDSQINRIKWEHIIDGKPASKESLDMRIFFPQELDYYLESNGYAIEEKYGDYGKSAFTSGSPIQLMVCRKKAGKSKRPTRSPPGSSPFASP